METELNWTWRKINAGKVKTGKNYVFFKVYLIKLFINFPEIVKKKILFCGNGWCWKSFFCNSFILTFVLGYDCPSRFRYLSGVFYCYSNMNLRPKSWVENEAGFENLLRPFYQRLLSLLTRFYTPSKIYFNLSLNNNIFNVIPQSGVWKNYSFLK